MGGDMHKRTLFLVAALFLVSSLMLPAQTSPTQPTATGGNGAVVQGTKVAAPPAGGGTAPAAPAPAALSTELTKEATPPSQVPAAPKLESAEIAFTNADVVKLTSLGMSSEAIITKINTAKQVAFKVETD